MMDIQKLRRFLSNDFRNAILSIREKDGELIPRLTLKEKSKLNGSFIGVYNEDLKEVRKDPLNACNYMLDNFLANHTVIGIKYFTYNQYQPDKTCFDIITTEGVFTIALGNCNIKDIFPDFVKRIEFAKREGILKDLSHQDMEKKKKLGKQLFLGLNRNNKDIKTGVGYCNYNILSLLKNSEIIIPKYERSFVIRYIQEILRMYGVTDECFFEEEAMKISDKKKEFLDTNRNCNSICELKIGNVTFKFYQDNRALIQLELIEEAFKGLESEFIYYSSGDIIKQLVIKNYRKIGGN